MALEARSVEFNQLPAATRLRFVQCTRSEAGPWPVLAERLGTGLAVVGWGLLLLVALGTLGGLAGVDFGRVNSGGLQGAGYIAGYVVATFLAVYSLFAIVRRALLVRSLPYTPGRYLFPMDFVDARTDKLRIVPMAMMVDFRGVHHHTNGVYTNTVFTFRFAEGITESLTIHGKELAERALESLRSTQAEVAQAVENRDIERLQGIDVFFEARMRDWQPEAPAPFGGMGAGAPAAGAELRARAIPGVLRLASLPALGLGLVLGGGLWLLRGMLSDAAAYDHLDRNGSIWEIERYVALGGSKAKTARTKLLPRAAFREAKAKGSVTAFRDVATKYPKTDAAKQAKQEIGALYAKTVKEFEAQAADNPEMRAFMTRLFAHLEQHDTPTVGVRFEIPSATDLKLADEVLNRKVQGGVVPIAGHFDEASSIPREDAIIRYLQSAFSAIFPADMFALRRGKRLGVEAADGASGPTLDIHYDVSPSGDTYQSERTGKNFVGIRVKFDVMMRLPGGDKPFRFETTVEPPDRFQVQSGGPLGDLGYTGDSAGAVYHAMATHAFEQLATKLRAVFFRPGTKAFIGTAPPATGE